MPTTCPADLATLGDGCCPPAGADPRERFTALSIPDLRRCLVDAAAELDDMLAEAGRSAEANFASPTLGAMKHIPAGTFTMGSPSMELWRSKDEVQHSVTLSHGFYLMERELTQSQWRLVMGNNPVETESAYGSSLQLEPCYSAGVGPDLPVVCVTWQEAAEFARRVSIVEAARYRLPTEAEWEYAARAGQPTVYSGSNDLDAVAWHTSNSGDVLHSGCRKLRNAWGLCDMTGNVSEWVADYMLFEPWSSSPVTDPLGPRTGRDRAVRGGAWFEVAHGLRVADRNWSLYARSYIGVRLVREEP